MKSLFQVFLIAAFRDVFLGEKFDTPKRRTRKVLLPESRFERVQHKSVVNKKPPKIRVRRPPGRRYQRHI